MSRRSRTEILTAACFAAASCGVWGCASQQPRDAAQRGAEQWRDALPGVQVDLERRALRVDAEFCIDRGILEYVAVAAGGKEYESLLRLKARPSQLHAALLLAGFEPGALRSDWRGDFDPNAAPHDKPVGAPATPTPPDDWPQRTDGPTTVRLLIESPTADGGGWSAAPIERYLIQRATGRSPTALVWGFTGSFFTRPPRAYHEVYIADIERSVAALWYDPTALFNLQADVGNPYRGEGRGLEVNEATVPPPGAPARLIVIAAENG